MFLKGNDFKYCTDDIKKIIKDENIHKVAMEGVYKDLDSLKPIIERLYNDKIFYLSYWKSECGWHGWDWTKDDGTMKNMANITDGITKDFEHIYALILGGLGIDEVDDKYDAG